MTVLARADTHSLCNAITRNDRAKKARLIIPTHLCTYPEN